MNNKEVVGFSSVNEDELMNVDGGWIQYAIAIVVVAVCGMYSAN